MAEKEVLTLHEIEEKVKEYEKLPAPANAKEIIRFIKPLIKDKEYEKVKRKLINHLVPALKKLPVAEYKVMYDAVGESLEPIYFWVLDFMRDPAPGGLGLQDVFKGPEDFEASVTSGYFSEVGGKATQMQAKAMEYFGAINQVIKSLLNLIYDLKEFETRIDMYKEMREEKDPLKRRGAANSVKGIWMDQVDMKKGKGSINMLAQDLGFVTIRDAFFYVDSEEDIEKLDLNERVKNILSKKLAEYKKWLDLSEKEITKRYQIERAYLKSQYGTLKLYAKWLKPYLIAAQKLRMKNFSTPDIVNAFSTMEMHISILGHTKAFKPGDIHESFKNVQDVKKYYAVLEVEMGFRGMPSAVTVQGGRQYVHGGRADLKFKAYVLDELELEAMKTKELYEDLDLVDEFVEGSLKELQEEMEKYINPVMEEEKKKKKEPRKPLFENPFKGTMKGMKELVDPLQKLAGKKISFQKTSDFIEGDIEKHAKGKAAGLCFVIYNLYKKLHGMLSV